VSNMIMQSAIRESPGHGVTSGSSPHPESRVSGVSKDEAASGSRMVRDAGLSCGSPSSLSLRSASPDTLRPSVRRGCATRSPKGEGRSVVPRGGIEPSPIQLKVHHFLNDDSPVYLPVDPALYLRSAGCDPVPLYPSRVGCHAIQKKSSAPYTARKYRLVRALSSAGFERCPPKAKLRGHGVVLSVER
jgi:hypothetical protein